jgi:hypothetical protein
MKTRHWNDNWPTPTWTEYKWQALSPVYYEVIVEKTKHVIDWLYKLENLNRNARWDFEAVTRIHVKFRNRDDAVAFRLAFPEFTIAKN